MNNKFSRKEIEAARYLGRLKPLRSDVVSKKAKVEEMETLAHPHGISYDRIKVQTSQGNPQETAMILVADALEEYYEALKRYQRTLGEISRLITMVEETNIEYASILRMYYIDACKTEKIALQLHISESLFFGCRWRQAHSAAAECLYKIGVKKEI